MLRCFLTIRSVQHFYSFVFEIWCRFNGNIKGLSFIDLKRQPPMAFQLVLRTDKCVCHLSEVKPDTVDKAIVDGKQLSDNVGQLIPYDCCLVFPSVHHLWQPPYGHTLCVWSDNWVAPGLLNLITVSGLEELLFLSHCSLFLLACLFNRCTPN